MGLLPSFRAGPPGAGLALGDEDGVGHRQVRGGVAVEHEPCLDPPGVHPPEPAGRSRDTNSANTDATSAEIPTWSARACSRIRAAREAGSFTVNTTPVSGTTRRPAAAACST